MAWALYQPIRQMIEAIIHQGAVMTYTNAVDDGRVLSWPGNVRRLADMLRPWRIRDVGMFGLPNCFVPDVSSSIDLGLLEFFARRFGRRYEMLMWPHAELARAGHWTLPREKTCIMLKRPTRLSVDDEGQFHCEFGPALAYGKDLRLWAWHGAIMPELAIERPERISMEMLESLPRETAYAIIERLGAARFVRRFGATKFRVDQTGTLWHRSIQARRETWTFACVQVKNGTPRPGGGFEQFYLTVPANLRSARAAVAWTYGLRERDYAVVVRT